jgi:hypothetical protein
MRVLPSGKVRNDTEPGTIADKPDNWRRKSQTTFLSSAQEPFSTL